MLFMVLLAALIVLIDVSGNNLAKEMMPLIYIPPDSCRAGKEVMEIDDDYTPEAIAQKAKEHIFEE